MILEMLNNGLCYLWGEGDWKLRPLHQQVIEALVAYLDAEKGSKIKLQLEQQYFMQFIPEGRINTFFFRKLPNHLLILDPAFQDCLFKIEVFVDGRKHYAQVTFAKGRIWSIEFKKPHKFFKGKNVRVGLVKHGKSKDTFTTVIDRAAHGRETDENP